MMMRADILSLTVVVVIAGCDGARQDSPHLPPVPPSNPADSQIADTPSPTAPDAEATVTADTPKDMILIPGGKFALGCKRDILGCFGGVRPYAVGDFFIDRTEVTVAAYRRCVESGRCTPPAVEVGRFCEPAKNNWDPRWDAHPINCVTAEQAETYCRSRGMHLPTRIQFQKAARGARDERLYPWGMQRPDCQRAVIDGVGPRGRRGPGCGTGRTWPVGSRPTGASPYGVLDLSGNVSEYVIGDNGPARIHVDEPFANLRPSISAVGGSFIHSESRHLVIWSFNGLSGGHDMGFRCVYVPYTSSEWKRIRQRY